ncbi:MAG: hypothetical protein GX593_08405 [Actinomycetales bacterium]|nr:hypothetical protein [Actinomycetales bacterium]
MAYAEHEVTGNLDALVTHLDATITSGSVTARLEVRSDRQIGDARLVVLAYERYSLVGGNRLGLTFSILGTGDRIAITTVTTGGSQAMFFKINTFGEEAFLDRAVAAITSFPG